MQKVNNNTLFVNRANNDYGEIFIYGIIGDSWSDEGVMAAAFTKEMRQLEKEYNTIRVRISSGGGSVFEGITIFNAIRETKAQTEAYIDGIAASMAMPVALACDKVYISRFSKGMSHRITGVCVGNADDMRSNADLMDELEGDIAEILSARTGLDVEATKKKYLSGSDRWINAKQAKEEGIVDDIYDGAKVSIPQNATTKQIQNAYNTVLLSNLNVDQKVTTIVL